MLSSLVLALQQKVCVYQLTQEADGASDVVCDKTNLLVGFRPALPANTCKWKTLIGPDIVLPYSVLFSS